MENLKTSTGIETADEHYPDITLKEDGYWYVDGEKTGMNPYLIAASLEPEMKKVRIDAERKKGRELAKKADQNRVHGRISAFCDVAVFFIRKDRLDIAQHVLGHFMIDRQKAVAALEADKRVRDLTLAYLDKAGAWGKLDVPEAL